MSESYNTYDGLVKHPFVDKVLKTGGKIAAEIVDRSVGLKVDVVYKRDPSENEFYCLSVGHCIVHLLSVVQQMEHTILYMSNFSPTERMKKAGISRHSHLLWSVENYIVRTQSVYDRLLILIDRVFHLHNSPSCISHESIVTNTHIERTKLPQIIKPLKKAIRKYYHERNTIIHQQTYLDDELRRIEAYTILCGDPNYDDDVKDGLKWDAKWSIKKFTWVCTWLQFTLYVVYQISVVNCVRFRPTLVNIF